MSYTCTVCCQKAIFMLLWISGLMQAAVSTLCAAGGEWIMCDINSWTHWMSMYHNQHLQQHQSVGVTMSVTNPPPLKIRLVMVYSWIHDTLWETGCWCRHYASGCVCVCGGGTWLGSGQVFHDVEEMQWVHVGGKLPGVIPVRTSCLYTQCACC